MRKPIQPSKFASIESDEDTPPPFLGSWKRVYLGVVAYLFALIVALYVLTVEFSYK
ncbi:MAG TPA: hypothetical protein VH351_04575 [Bryobacteraceae bacterium]|jgi:hypothetical protein|nr:hypothetical protein [Bryobacteraceae bacterium]